MRFKEFKVNEAGPLDNFYAQFLGWGKNSGDDQQTAADGSQPGKVSPDVSAIQDPDFNKKLQKIATALGVSPNAIMSVIKKESGGRPDAVNKYTGATGLIQFMPDTARRLGTTVEKLRTMTAVQQLDYVYKYYVMVGVRPGSNAGDLYVATFMPAAMNKGDGHILGRRGAGGFSGKVYSQNKGLDVNRDGVITVADIKNSVTRVA